MAERGISPEIENNIVKISGTDHPGDIPISLKCWPKWSKKLKTFFHAGYLDESILNVLSIASKLDIEKPVSMILHSMGAPVGVISALFLSELGYNISHIEMMGSPNFMTRKARILLKNKKIKIICRVKKFDFFTLLFPWFCTPVKSWEKSSMHWYNLIKNHTDY